MREGRVRWIAVVAAYAAGAAFAAPPEPVPSPPDAPVKHIVEQAIDRGSKVILKRVDYTDGAGGGAAAAPAGPVRSRTYIEIDSRPPGAGDDREMVESQRRIEESQREMLRSVAVIEAGQNRSRETLRAVEGRGREVSGGMESGAAEVGALRGSAADVATQADDAGNAVVDAEKILRQIGNQTKELSGSIDELSARMGREGRRGERGASTILDGAAPGTGLQFEGAPEVE